MERRRRVFGWFAGVVAAGARIGEAAFIVDVVEVDGGVLIGFCHPPPSTATFLFLGIR